MTLNTHEMRGVRVETRAGQAVGKVASFDLDQATGRLATLRVKVGGLIPGLLDDELAVSWDAIVEMSREKVVVADGVVKAPVGALAQAKAALTSPSLMKEG